MRSAWMILLPVLVIAACSGSDGAAPAGTETTPAPVSAPSPPTSVAAPATEAPGAEETVAATVIATVPDTGVPGIDSDDLFCRSWSRFAGSFQVVAVAATFGEGGSVEAATLEVMASPVVVASYRDFLENVPDEAVEESDVVARDFPGPYARRSERALTALRDAGADDVMLEAIAAAWLDALAERDPMSPTLEVALQSDVEVVVVAAAADFDAQLVPIPLDPSLVSEAEVPLTERYLSDNCPDRGALAGSEVQG
jgi:hypothetical protein